MNRFIFIIFSVFVMSVSVLGQDPLQNDLHKSFKKFDLVNLNKQDVLQKAKSKRTIEFEAYGREFEFVLTPNDIRANNYKAVETTAYGDREMEKAEVFTYKGKLKDDADSEVRFSLTDKTLEGFIYTGDNKRFYISEAQNFSDYAAKDEAVVYTEGDIIKNIDLSNDVAVPSATVEDKIGFGLEYLQSYIFGSEGSAQESPAGTPEVASATAAYQEIEVATEADYQWVTQAGGATAANNGILSIMNLVDGIYKRDLNLSVRITYQHAWSTTDPFSSSSMSAQLDTFLNYWNSNFPYSQYPRDVAHLFTRKFTNQGLAYVGAICRNPGYSYGITGNSGSVNHLIAAHEIGHNLGADHVDNSGSCASSMMNPSLTSSAAAFCDYSKTQIGNYVASNGRCLTASTGNPTPTPTPYSTPTPTPTPFPTPTATPTPFATPTPTVTPTPPGGRTNVALSVNGGSATASSQSAPASAAIDSYRNWASTGAWKDATPDSYPDWLQVNFNGSKTINEIAVYAVTDDYWIATDPTDSTIFSQYGITQFEVQYWNGSGWVTVPGGSIANNNRVITRITFSGITTTGIRVVVYNAQASYSRIVELEVLSGGTVNPTPTPTPYVTPTPNITPTPNVTPTATPTPYATPTPNVTPTPPAGRTNVASASNGSVATASSQSASPSIAIDGIKNWATSGAWKDATFGNYPDWFQVDFNGNKTINEINIYGVRDDYTNSTDPIDSTISSIYGITNFEVQYWNGSGWVTVPGGSITNNNKVLIKVSFSGVTTNKIRVLINNAHDGYSRIVELEAWSGGTVNPTPTPTPTASPTPTFTPTPTQTPTPSVSPTPTVRTNVALASNGSVATASSELSSPSAAIDGIRNWATSGAWKDTTFGAYPDWMQVDFNGSKTINEINVYAVTDDYWNPVDPTTSTLATVYGITNFDVQYWNGSSWVTVPNGSVVNTNKVLTKIVFSPITTSKVRVVVNNAQDGFSRIVELEAWSGGTASATVAANQKALVESETLGTAISKLFVNLKSEFVG